MKNLSPSQLLKLMQIERKYKCDFYLPPFGKKANCYFFDINKIHDDAVMFREFLIEVKKVKVEHEFITVGGRKFMTVMEKDLPSVDRKSVV